MVNSVEWFNHIVVIVVVQDLVLYILFISIVASNLC